ncbi:hypothetical protein GYMLUDRAFT_253712, partial [Collybiopsis luxurians FD-317 M1]
MGLERNRGRRQPPRQQVSATSSVPFTLFPNEPAQVAASVPSPANPTTTTPNLTVQIAQLQELLNRANAMAPEQMGRSNRKKRAAIAREVRKRGEQPIQRPKTPQKVTVDPDYVASSDSESDLDPYVEDNTIDASLKDENGSTSSQIIVTADDPSLISQKAAQAEARKRRHEDGDIYPDTEQPKGISAATSWRNRTGKTKKARAVLNVRNIGSFFVPVPKKPKISHQIESLDSDIEIITYPSSSPTVHLLDEDQLIDLDNPQPPIIQESFDSISEEIEIPSLTSDMESIKEVTPVASVAGDEPTLENLGDTTEVEDDDVASLEDIFSTSPQAVHERLSKAIKSHLKLLRKSKTMLSDQQAANKVFDLEALRRYNDLRLELIEKREAWQKKIASAPSKIRPLLEARQPKILSAQQASQKVA